MPDTTPHYAHDDAMRDLDALTFPYMMDAVPMPERKRRLAAYITSLEAHQPKRCVPCPDWHGEECDGCDGTRCDTSLEAAPTRCEPSEAVAEALGLVDVAAEALGGELQVRVEAALATIAAHLADYERLRGENTRLREENTRLRKEADHE